MRTVQFFVEHWQFFVSLSALLVLLYFRPGRKVEMDEEVVLVQVVGAQSPEYMHWQGYQMPHTQVFCSGGDAG